MQIRDITDKHRLEFSEQDKRHAQLTKEQEDRFIAQLKELHDRLAN